MTNLGDKYERKDIIIDGGYGVVLKVEDKRTGKPYALKCLQTKNMGEGQLANGNYKGLDNPSLDEGIESIQKEIEFLKESQEKSMQHHLIPLIDSGTWEVDKYNPHDGIATGVKVKAPAFVMPLADRPLSSLFLPAPGTQPDDVSLQDILCWVRQVAVALNFIHQNGSNNSDETLVHRDIKPDNLLLIKSDIYLIDFGLIKEQNKHASTQTYRGTTQWMAPERILADHFDDAGNKKIKFGAPADIYELGMVLYWLLTGGAILKVHYYSAKSSDPSGYLTLYKNGKVDLKLGLVGKIGGMDKDECKRLFTHYLPALLCINENVDANKTCMRGPVRPELPDKKYILEKLYKLVTDLLAKDPALRPKAWDVIDRVERLEAFLDPVLKDLTVTPPTEAKFGEKFSLTVKAQGKGLPQPIGSIDGWLNVQISREDNSDVVLPKQFTLAETNTWEIFFPDIEDDGTHIITATASVKGKTVRKQARFSVTATEEQLWSIQHYGKVLIRRPHDQQWQKMFETASGDARQLEHCKAEIKKAYDHFLEKSGDNGTMAKQYPWIGRMYYSLHEDRPGRNRWPKPAVLLLFLLVLFVLAGLTMKLTTTDQAHQTVQSPVPAKQRQPIQAEAPNSTGREMKNLDDGPEDATVPSNQRAKTPDEKETVRISTNEPPPVEQTPSSRHTEAPEQQNNVPTRIKPTQQPRIPHTIGAARNVTMPEVKAVQRSFGLPTVPLEVVRRLLTYPDCAIIKETGEKIDFTITEGVVLGKKKDDTLFRFTNVTSGRLPMKAIMIILHPGQPPVQQAVHIVVCSNTR